MLVSILLMEVSFICCLTKWVLLFANKNFSVSYYFWIISTVNRRKFKDKRRIKSGVIVSKRPKQYTDMREWNQSVTGCDSGILAYRIVAILYKNLVIKMNLRRKRRNFKKTSFSRCNQQSPKTSIQNYRVKKT